MRTTTSIREADQVYSSTSTPAVHFYPAAEERFNIISHGFGFVLSVIGTYFLIVKAQHYQQWLPSLSLIIYGMSMVCLYAASTLYHSAKKPNRRRILNIVDHSAIYILIAGSYTPFTTITLEGTAGQILFISIWACAILGVTLKLFFTGRYNKLSTIMYVLMGWMAIFAIKPLIANLHPTGLGLVALGGILYTVGAIFYSLKSMKFNHGIFHIFVLGGSLSHFMAIYFYV